MATYLAFDLQGAMASWGDVAVGEVRPSLDHPTRSAVLGLIAACLGIRRDDKTHLQELTNGISIAVVTVDAGKPLVDYHTSQVPSSKRGSSWRTRKDELEYDPSELNTILSSRTYRSDGWWRTYLWRSDELGPTLERIAEAIAEPSFMPYLGRRSCPLGRVMHPRLVEAATLGEAIATDFANEPPEDFTARRAHRRVAEGSRLQVHFDGTDCPGLDALDATQRRDEPVDRGRWLFDTRTEHRAVLEVP